MQKHLQHYGYFTGEFRFCLARSSRHDSTFAGRHEVVKKYGFVPSKPQLISSSSDSNSSSDDEDQGNDLD